MPPVIPLKLHVAKVEVKGVLVVLMAVKNARYPQSDQKIEM